MARYPPLYPPQNTAKFPTVVPEEETRAVLSFVGVVRVRDGLYASTTSEYCEVPVNALCPPQNSAKSPTDDAFGPLLFTLSAVGVVRVRSLLYASVTSDTLDAPAVPPASSK